MPKKKSKEQRHQEQLAKWQYGVDKRNENNSSVLLKKRKKTWKSKTK